MMSFAFHEEYLRYVCILSVDCFEYAETKYVKDCFTIRYDDILFISVVVVCDFEEE